MTTQTPHAAGTPPLAVTIVSDVICPWCWLGRARLMRGAAQSGIDLAVVWRPFELNPDMPEAGMARADYRAAKMGRERSDALDAEMVRMGAEEGLDFRFDRQARTPNTRKAHMLIAFAGAAGAGRDDVLASALFAAYFREGADLSDDAVLIALAEGVGLDAGQARLAVADPELRALVAREEERGRAMGISGVPFFVLADRYGVSGAQPAEVWAQALPEIAGKRNEG